MHVLELAGGPALLIACSALGAYLRRPAVKRKLRDRGLW